MLPGSHHHRTQQDMQELRIENFHMFSKGHSESSGREEDTSAATR